MNGSTDKGTVSLSSLVEGALEKAVLTTFMVDLEWLLDTLPVLASVPVLLVHGMQTAVAAPPNFTLLSPRMPRQFGVCHGKCFVLFYPSRLRLIVSTANLLDCDYERKTQGLWYEDFALKSAKHGDPASSVCDFEETLVDYLKRVGVPPAFLRAVRQFDFEGASAVLLSSVPGVHRGEERHRYGHMQLRRILSGVAEVRTCSSPLVCQASSMGLLDEPFLGELLASFNGAQTSVPRGLVAEQIRIVWPTVHFVRTSIDGCAIRPPLRTSSPFSLSYQTWQERACASEI